MKGNFTFYNPTKIYFGEGAVKNLKEELIKYGTNIMLAYGGGSIKKIGLYEEIIVILKELNKNIIEFSGIMPNPTKIKLLEGAKLAKENDIDLILAVGGGSVIDCAKAVAVSAHSKEEPWNKYFIEFAPINNRVIPVASILTMVGTGSEMNTGSVITDEDNKLKIGRVFTDDEMFPKFSILDPKLTFTVSKYQMISGIFDIMSHLTEQYFSGEDDNVSDYLIEGLLKSLIHSAKVAVIDSTNYEARSNLMWNSTLALNTLVGKGKDQDWQIHMTGQQVGAYTDAAHGMTLSAISIPYYRYVSQFGLDKFARYATTVWDVRPEGKTKKEIVNEGLNRMESFMKELGVVMSLKELGVTKEMLPLIAESSVLTGGYKQMTVQEILYILEESF